MAAQQKLDFDPAALHRKYLLERDKRLRTEANDQYLEVKGDFSRYVDDPYVEPGFTRPPLNDEMDVVIIGGGFGGLLAGARLRQAGVQGIRIIDKAGDFGGTWYWNRYPGAQCDVESYIYLPLLEETGFIPREKYTRAPEILEHSRRIGRTFDLYRDACLQTQISSMHWDEAEHRWIIRTNRNDRMKARYVIMSNGPLNRPKLPGIPGIADYQGHTFHTSRWDYAYTGGSSLGGLEKLRDKRVGIIGTGATAVQCVPYLGEFAKQLYVFQRTPSSVDIRNNRETDPDWAKSLTLGWQKRRMDNFNVLVSGGYQDEDLVADGWTDIIRNVMLGMSKDQFEGASAQGIATAMELADYAKMNGVRGRVDSVVKDAKTAEALKPWYRQFCKRPCFNDEYLDTFNRPNVQLVDTDGRGVDRITPKGVVVDGVEYEVDCLIFATGFEVGTGYTRRSGFDVAGRDGVRLSDKWDNGAVSLHGTMSHGFPNCFFMGLTQNTLTINFPHMLDDQSHHIAYIIGAAEQRQARAIEPSLEAEKAWCDTVKKSQNYAGNFLQECTPGYYNGEGRTELGHGLTGNTYGGTPMACEGIMREWRETGELPGMHLV
ncbi:MAG: NAD(P)/FAD-dependent oxidoreductase [Gammaproteobacteria bacterium]|nr:NAD(P)/FAD-dependent oxidoreductase [Gammaproteobacteria bacterium]